MLLDVNETMVRKHGMIQCTANVEVHFVIEHSYGDGTYTQRCSKSPFQMFVMGRNCNINPNGVLLY